MGYDTYTYDSANSASRVELVGQSSNTSVQRISAGYMAPGQTAKNFTAKVATSTIATTTVTLYTVTTGKTFYVTDINIFTDSTTAIDGSIQAAGTKIFNFGTSTTAPAQANAIETQPSATSTQAVTMLLPQTTGSIQNVWYNISGFEQ